MKSMQSTTALDPSPRRKVEEPASPQKYITLQVHDTGIGVLTFDRPGSAANVFDRPTMLELSERLDDASRYDGIKGLVILSAKESIFLAGADIKSLVQCNDLSELSAFVELGQDVFNRIAALPFPTVAAIHGACVGGGYELCLACDYRIASDERVTKIGLPETKLGLLPAWGGSSRLPRLIGLPRAIDLILEGKTLSPKAALESGLIDSISPRARLLEGAIGLLDIANGKPRSRSQSLANRIANSSLGSHLICAYARSRVRSKARGNYPALTKALEVILAGARKPLCRSLDSERDGFLGLVQGEPAQNLTRLFLMQERSKKLLGGSSPGNQTHPVMRRVAVYGAGIMGAGIAQWLSSRKINVFLHDVDHSAIESGMKRINGLLADAVRKDLMTRRESRACLDRIVPGVGEIALDKVDLIIEAASEKLDVKQDLFRRLSARIGEATILASNTSAISISEIGAATLCPDRVVGIHFFNPVHKMQLVEVVVGSHSSPEAVRRAVRLVQQIGKLPLVVKDKPGFLVNRILMPYLMEAELLFRGGATVEDIDEAMLDFGMPMGPLRLIDEVGIDICHHVARDLASKFPERLQPSRMLARMVDGGILGKKTKKGFYDHAHNKVSKPNRELNALREHSHYRGLSRAELCERMILLTLNEAARCLEENVVGQPEDVDFGMVMGTGWAPFRGGPLRYADVHGIEALCEKMSTLATREHSRFAPCELLKRMAGTGERFYPAA